MTKDIDAKIDDLASMVAQGFSELRKDMNDGFVEVRSDIQELGGRMNAVERRLGSVEESLEEVKEAVSGIARAVDADAETLIDHDRRITALETQSV